MQMSQAVGTTVLDTLAGGQVGRPIDRVDGLLKVTGTAPYSAEIHEDGCVYGHIVSAGIGVGKIVSIDTSHAEAMPGVLSVLTHENAPEQGEGPRAYAQLKSARVEHWGQAVALVVARTFEQARDAAAAVEVRYQAEPGRYDRDTIVGTGKKPPPDASQEGDTALGDFDGAFDKAEVRLDATYRTPDQSHAAMEPHATLAVWKDDKLTLHTAHQMLGSAHKGVAGVLELDTAQVRVVSRYIGGGFGGKLDICADAVLAGMAARRLGLPVKVVQSRQQVFFNTSRRTETEQRVRLGAHRDGTLVAIGHETWCDNIEGDPFFEPAGLSTRFLYAAPHRRVTHRVATLDKVRAASMRAPGEAVGMVALECAMDELAEALGMCPVQLRIRNEPALDPEQQIPFSSRNLVACLKEGAERFGWSGRTRAPRQRSEDGWWIGSGMASAARGNLLQKSMARVVLQADGSVLVQTSMTDIGTGTYTVLTQIASDMLGVEPARVQVELGDTDFPVGAGSGGSWGASSSGSSVYDACEKIRGMLAERAGMVPAKARIEDGMLTDGSVTLSIASLAEAGALEAKGEIKPGTNHKTHQQASFGAHFCEVAVHGSTGEVRVRRMLGVFAAGRILNEKTARSQCYGGIVFGIGTALTEELSTDLRHGSFVNHDLAEYHVPTHADVPDLEVVFLRERDEWSNPLKSKGIGELGISGAAAAVANAVYNACGVRVRDFPITLDKLIEGGLPPQ